MDGLGGDHGDRYSVKEDSLLAPRCFLLSLHVCAKHVDLCMLPTYGHIPRWGCVQGFETVCVYVGDFSYAQAMAR